MMTTPDGPKLAAYVDVTDPDGKRVWLGPDDDVPPWAVGQIVNPKAWEGGKAPKVDDEPPHEPPPEPKRPAAPSK